MYIPTKNFDTPQEQEIVCLLTGESYVYLEGDDTTLIESKYLDGATETLPLRFHSTPWVIRNNQGQIRVFGKFE